MVDKIISAFPNEAPSDSDIFEKENAAGNSRHFTGPQLKSFVQQGWELLTSWDHVVSGDTANIDVTDLSAYAELLILGRLTTTSVSANRRVLCSINNGASYYNTSGDYVILAAAGTESADSALFGLSVGSSAARSFSIRLQSINLTDVPKVSITPSNLTGIFVASYDPVNAIRVGPTAGLLTGGRIWILAKR